MAASLPPHGISMWNLSFLDTHKAFLRCSETERWFLNPFRLSCQEDKYGDLMAMRGLKYNLSKT